ncbi:MAG: helix-turn-helix transcriptional regulator [Oscillibacter sp.]|nr:helix-turn-helix transcriptional regulator [Oscillibacter sp.]
MTINERIKKVRKTLDLTQAEFGKRIRLKGNSIALIEGGRNTSEQTIFSICKEFNVNEQWLRLGEGEMFVAKSKEDELSDAVDTLLSGEPSEWRRRLVVALSRFSPSDWDRLERELRFILDGESPDRIATETVNTTHSEANFYRLPQDMTPEELHAELDRQIADEKGRRDVSSDSGSEKSDAVAG